MDPTYINSRKHKEFFKGYVLKADGIAIIKMVFNYGIVINRSYTLTQAGIPMQFSMPTETIRTSRVDIPFAHNDKVELADGRTMTVTDIARDVNPHKAFTAGGAGTTAWILTLQGGAPNV